MNMELTAQSGQNGLFLWFQIWSVKGDKIQLHAEEKLHSQNSVCTLQTVQKLALINIKQNLPRADLPADQGCDKQHVVSGSGEVIKNRAPA